jgi:hypothetical protein
MEKQFRLREEAMTPLRETHSRVLELVEKVLVGLRVLGVSSKLE